MKNLCVIFVLIISLAACGQSSKIDVESTPKNPMPDSVCYFFPSDKTFNKISSNSFDIPQKGDNLPMCCKYLVAVTKKNIDIDSIMNFVEDNSVQILTDSSKLYVLRNKKFDKREILDSIYLHAQISNIIPDFRLFEGDTSNIDSLWVDSSTNTGLSFGYVLYVIKSGNTLVLNEKWNCNRQWLPMHLQHGYRSGIAINPDNEYVLFWSIAW